MSANLTSLSLTTRFFGLNLVQQLRLVFFLIISVVGTALILAIYQFQTLRDKQAHLLYSSVPVLVLVQSIERELSGLILNVGKIEFAEDLQALEPARKAAEISLTNAAASVTGLTRNPAFEDQSKNILKHLHELQKRIAGQFVIKEELLENRQGLVRMKGLLDREKTLIRRQFDEMAITASAQVDQSISDHMTTTSELNEPLRKNLIARTAEVTLISTIALEMEAFFGVVENLGETLTLVEIFNSRAFLEQRLREAILSTSNIDDVDQKVALAQKIVRIRSLVFDDLGILGLAENFARLSRDFGLQSVKSQELVQSVSSATELLLAASSNNLEEAGKLTETTTQSLIIILAAAISAMLLIVAFALYFVLERRINRRLSHLAQSVLLIAKGETDTVIEVNGADELGHMASALETFKSNARELMRSNKELEKFAYVASHDLRSPLQGISDLTDWTVSDPDNSLSEDSLDNLNLIQIRVSRLQNLLSDLLEYARVDGEMMTTGRIDIEEMIAEISSEVDPVGKFEVVTVSTLGVVESYQSPLRKILNILIENTVKHHDKSSGQIIVSAQLSGKRIVVEYSDDGPGIDPEYHEKIFELFQTLRPRDDKEGSGVGLAMSRKLVEAFNGKIKIDSNPKRNPGSKFTFDFPTTAISELTQAA